MSMSGSVSRCLFFALFILICGSSAGHAIDNSGFMADTSTLKERFPACEAFLNIAWADKAQRIGTLKADVYQGSTGKETLPLLIKLESPGSVGYGAAGSTILFDIDPVDYRTAKLEGLLQGASYSFTHHRVFLHAKKGKAYRRFVQQPLPFEARAGQADIFPDKSFSGFTRTVCAVYPDASKAFVIEAKRPFLSPPADERMKQVFDQMKKAAEQRCVALRSGGTADCSLDGLRDAYAIDMDGDGMDEYLFTVGTVKPQGSGTARSYLFIPGRQEPPQDMTSCLAPGRFIFGISDGPKVRLGRCIK